MVKLLKSDILLMCTWLFLLGLVIYFGPIKGLEPPTVPLVLLVIIALIPLAERLKIGNWVDFTRKVENLSKEVSSTQEEVREIKNVLISNIQGQQQFNISIASEEAARGLAEFISLRPKLQYSLLSIQKERLVDEDAFFSEKMSPTDRQRFLFISVVDRVIAEADPLMRILYTAKLTKQKHKVPSGRQVYRDKDILPIIEKLQRDWCNVFAVDSENTNELQQRLESIKTLIKLREDVYEMNIEPPPIEEGNRLIFDGYSAAAYFTGYISGGYSALLLPS